MSENEKPSESPKKQDMFLLTAFIAVLRWPTKASGAVRHSLQALGRQSMGAVLRCLGAVFLALLVSLGIAAAVYVPKLWKLERTAIAYVESSVPLIVANWDPAEVTKRAAPEFLVPSIQEGLPVVFAELSRLGKLRSLRKPEGGVVVADFQMALSRSEFRVRTRDQRLGPLWAEFVADAEFEAGPAKVKMTLVRRGNEWRIIGFWVRPPWVPHEG